MPEEENPFMVKPKQEKKEPEKTENFGTDEVVSFMVTPEEQKKKDKLFNGGKSSEGAWIASIGNLEAFEVIAKACEEVGNELDFECGFGIDVAASSLWNEKEEKYFG